MKVKSVATLCGSATGLALLHTLDAKIQEKFPPESILDLKPTEGHKVFGYMGCPESCVERIKKKERLLFFAETIDVAQCYANSRTPMWDQVLGVDRPVVVQLEIPKHAKIPPEELWTDRLRKQPIITPVPQPVAMWPAIPPKIQKKTCLKVRIHHVVTAENLQKGGARRRALNYLTTMLSSIVT